MEPNELTDRESTKPEETNEEVSNEGFDLDSLRHILEGVLLAAARPLSLDQLQAVLGGETAPDKGAIRRALADLEQDCTDRGVELVEVASGFRLQVRQELQPWVSRLWEERPPRYSRALLETLALIAYKQPITRGEIEDVRGVSVSTNIIRQLEEREWIRVVGHRDVPGKPALFGTTKAFLDYFGLKSLDEMPSLAEIRDIENLEPELDFSGESEAGRKPEAGQGEEVAGEEQDSVEPAEAQTPARPGTDTDDETREEGVETELGEAESSEHSGEDSAEAGPAGEDADEVPSNEGETDVVERASDPEADAEESDRDGADETSLTDHEAASGGRR